MQPDYQNHLFVKKLLSVLLLALSVNCFSQSTLIKYLNVASQMYQVNGHLLFCADTGASLSTLWVSDGTPDGTYPLMPNLIAVASSRTGYSYYEPVVFNNELYFIGNDSQATYYPNLAVWKSDGTAAGTVPVKVFGTQIEGPSGTNYPFFCVSNNQLFFAAGDGVHGVELWKTDGTNAGTILVKDISTDSIYGSQPAFLTNYNNELYFTAYDAAYGTEIWKSDGTEGGTVLFKDIIPGHVGVTDLGYGGGSFDPQFTISGNYLFFSGRIDTVSVNPHQYRTDGTPNGTMVLDTLNRRYDNEDPNGPFQVDVNGTLMYLGLTDAPDPLVRNI